MLSEADGLSYAIDLAFGAYGAVIGDLVPCIFCLASFGIVSIIVPTAKEYDRIRRQGVSNVVLRGEAGTMAKETFLAG